MRSLATVGVLLIITVTGLTQVIPGKWSDWRTDSVFSKIEWRTSCAGRNEFANRFQINLELRNNYSKNVRVSTVLGQAMVEDVVIAQGKVAQARAFVPDNCDSDSFALRIGNVTDAAQSAQVDSSPDDVAARAASSAPRVESPPPIPSARASSSSNPLGIWEHVGDGEGLRDGTIKFHVNYRDVLRLEGVGETFKGSYLKRAVGTLQSGAAIFDDRLRIEFELRPVHEGAFIAKLIGGTYQGSGGSARVIVCSRCTSWQGRAESSQPAEAGQIVGDLAVKSDGTLLVNMFWDTASPHLASQPRSPDFLTFHRAQSQTAFDEFLASEARLRELSTNHPEIAAAAVPTDGRNMAPAASANPDLKLLQKKATDVKYVVGAVGYAEAWAQAADANGTAAEKALAHKWLDAHKQAQRFDVECRGCANPPTMAEAYAGKSEFYKNQGKEFKAFAQYWDRRWVRANEQETGEHIPTTAEVLAGVAADTAGVVAQGRAQRAAIERGQLPGQTNGTVPQQTANGQASANEVNNDVDSVANQWRATGLQFSPATITRYADSATAGPFVNLSVTISSPIGGTAGWLLECGEVSNNGLGPAFHGVQTRQGNAWGNFTPSGTRISVDFSPGNSGGDHVCRILVSPKRPGERCCSGRGDNGSGNPMLNSTFHVTVKNIERSGGVR